MSNVKLQLAVAPKLLRFPGTSDGADSLRAYLQAKDSAGPRRIQGKEDLLLHEGTGRLPGGFRLTAAALSQICSTLCPGLGLLVTDLSGLRKRKAKTGDRPQTRYSVLEAIRTFNALVRFRGEQLVGNELILDRRSQTVEGLVGPEYRFLANLDFWGLVQEFLSDGLQVTFRGATYRSRRLALRYTFTGRPPIRRPPHRAGWHFGNSEIGDCAVHMAGILMSDRDRVACMIPFPDVKKLVHRGHSKAFFGKLDAMFVSLRRKLHVVRELGLESRMSALVETSLGLGQAQKKHQKRLLALRTKLTQGKLGPRLAARVLYKVLFPEDNEETTSFEKLCLLGKVETFQSRTLFDLYHALGVVARSERPEKQELAEQLAFRVLLGQVA